jgi:hypothetical protein
LDTATLLNQLRRERDELSATISVLERRTGSSATPKSGTAKPHGRHWSAADRAKMSKLIRARLASKKKALAARKGARKPKAAPKPHNKPQSQA